MTTDLFKGHNQSDGEGIVYSDMNDAVRFITARLYDQIVESLIGDHSLTGGLDAQYAGARGANAPTHLAYTLHGGQAYLRQGSANNKVQIAPGVLLQKIANQTGNEHSLLAYSFVGTEEVAIAAGSGTNPRVDLVQMSLAYSLTDSQTRNFKDAITGAVTTTTTSKKRVVTCTLSVKQGTPAASPQVPDPDAGNVAVATVVVGTSYAIGTALTFGVDTAGNVAVVHDQRMPIGVTALFDKGADFMYGTGGSEFAPIAGRGGILGSGAATTVCCSVCPYEGTGRVVGIGFYQDGAHAIGTARLGAAVPTSGSIPNAQPTSGNTLTLGANLSAEVPYYTFEGAHVASAGPTVLPSTTNKIGVPIWTNGRRCPFPTSSALSATQKPVLVAAFTTGTTLPITIVGMRWQIAVGL